MRPDHPPHRSSSASPSPERRIRPAHIAAIAAAGVAAIGLVGLKFVTLPEAASVAPGDALKIEVVAPVEPKLAPGAVMEVGELVDGFRYVPPRPSNRDAVYDVAWTDEEDFAARIPPARPVVRRHTSGEVDAAPPANPEPPRRERERRWFGFDNPLPDFGAERRARQARLDAIEDRRRAEFEDRAVRRYSSEAPRHQQPRHPGRNHEPARADPPVDQVGEGPYGPEVG